MPRRGTLLGDLLLALGMLLLLAAMSFTLFASSAATMTHSRNLTLADNWVQSMLDCYQSDAFNLPLGDMPVTPPAPEWQARLTIGPVAPHSDRELRSLKALVRWDYQGQQRTLERTLVVVNLYP